MKIKIFVLIIALLVLFISCENLFEIKGRWNRNDPNYDPTNDPVNQPNLPPIAPSNLNITFFVDKNDGDTPCVKLNWQNNSTYTQKTLIERAPEGSSDFTKVGEVKYIVSPDGQDTTSEQFIDNGLSTAQLSEIGFVYRIKAVNPSGSSDAVDKLFYCPPMILDFDAIGNTTGSTYGNEEEIFTFSYEHYGIIDSITWDYGDGNTTTLKYSDPIPTKSFSQNGLYQVTLTASGPGSNGKPTILQKTNFIAIGIPRAEFSLYADLIPGVNGNGTGRFETEITDSVIMNPGETIYIKNEAVFYKKLIWSSSFDDNLLDMENEAGSEYTIPEVDYGQYTIYQYALGSGGEARFAEANINVGRGELTFTCAGMDENDRSVTIIQGESLTFNYDFKGFEPITLSIDYGNGTTKIPDLLEKSTSYTFNNPNIYNCTLSMTTGFTGEGTITKSIEVTVLGRNLVRTANNFSPGSLQAGKMDNDNDTDFLFIDGTGTHRSLMWIDVNSANASTSADFVRNGSAPIVENAEILQARLIDVGENHLYLLAAIKSGTDITFRLFKPSTINKMWTEVSDSTLTITADTACFAVGLIDGSIPDLVVYSSHSYTSEGANVVDKTITCYSGQNSNTNGEAFLFNTSGAVLEANSPAAANGIIVTNLSEKDKDEILLLADGNNGKTVYFYEKPAADGAYARYDLSINNAHLVDIGDMDGDHNTDLVIHTLDNQNSGNLYWYKNQSGGNDGASSFVSASLNYTHSVNTLSAMDIDDDGISELLFGSYNTSLTYRKLNGSNFEGETYFYRAADNNRYYNSIAMGDIDGDGKQDLVVSEAKGIYWYPNSMVK